MTTRPEWVDAFNTSHSLDLLASSRACWDSIQDAPNGRLYRRRSVLDSVRLRTSAEVVGVECYSNAVTYPAQSTITVVVDGAVVAEITPSVGVVSTTEVSIGAGANKLVEIYEGAQDVSLAGAWLRRVFVPSGAPLGNLAVVAPSRRMVVFGDSKACGFLVRPNVQSWNALARATFPGRITTVAHGGLALASESLPSMADYLIGACDAATNQIWIDVTFNDWFGAAGDGIPGWTAAAFEAKMQSLLTTLRASPKVGTIYCIGTIVSSYDGDVNMNGDTLADFRAACAAASSGRATYVDATVSGWPTLADLSDGVHENPTGYVKYATQFKSTVGY